MEGILLNAYKCSANISVYIEWDLLLQKYYPEKSRNEIFDIIDPFIRDRSSFLSIQSIRWIYENESIYNLPSITESVRRFYENSDSIWNEVSYF